jgi:hypothetical protein
MISTSGMPRFVLIFLSLFLSGQLMGQSKYEGPKTIGELKSKIEEVLKERGPLPRVWR